MKRFSVLLAPVFLVFAIVGCENGIEEGMPKDIPQDAMPAGFKAEQEKNAAKMIMKKPAAAKAPAAKTGTP